MFTKELVFGCEKALLKPRETHMQNKMFWPAMRHRNKYLITAALLLASGWPASAADFKGATEVLREASQAAPKRKEKPKDPYEPFREKLKAFQSQSASLQPAEAA